MGRRRRDSIAPQTQIGWQDAQETLSEIRSEPRLVLLNTAVVRSLLDTQALWAASKMATLETIGLVHEQRCLMILQQKLDVDDEAVRIRLREIRMQLQGTVGTWREHKKFLEEQCAQIAASILKSENEVAESKSQLTRRIKTLSMEGAPASAASPQPGTHECGTGPREHAG